MRLMSYHLEASRCFAETELFIVRKHYEGKKISIILPFVPQHTEEHCSTKPKNLLCHFCNTIKVFVITVMHLSAI